MKKVPVIAKSKGQPDVAGECVQYENIAEAVKALTEVTVLALVNRQVKTDTINKLRRPPETTPVARAVSKALSGKDTPEDLKKKLMEILQKDPRVAALLKEQGVTA